MRPARHVAHAPSCHVLARLMLLLSVLFAGHAHADRNFSLRFLANTEGDLVLIGNMNLHCPNPPSANCTSARAGGNFSNNGFSMGYVDADADSGTFNSSSADLAIPPGSTVLFAGLYWHGRSRNAARGQVLFRTPGAFGYALLNATVIDEQGTADPARPYQGFRDVTAQVAAAGSGTYWLANIQATQDTGFEAGWSLVVVYSNIALPLRNFAVYDGFLLASNSTVTIPVGGFLTPLSGPIVTRLGVVVYDGDQATGGDQLRLNGMALSNAVHPVGNAYLGRISDLGVNVTSRNPVYINTLGHDVARFNVPPGIIPNGATSAVISVVSPSTGEIMWPGVVTFATDIYVPIITPNVVKTALDINGGQLLAGEELQWDVVMSNTGLDTATQLVATDYIPAGLTYVPGSLQIVTGANAGMKSDAVNADQAEYIGGPTPRVVFRLGAGANGTNGGTLAYGEETSFRFRTIVNSGLPAGTQLVNSVSLSYSGQTIGDVFTATSAAATATVMAPPAITKFFSPTLIDAGGVSTLTIEVSNPSDNPVTLSGVTFNDTYPAGLTNAASPNPQVSCTPGAAAGTRTGGAPGGDSIGMNPGATLPANGRCTITVNVTAASTGNYTNSTSPASSTNGGSSAAGASATLSVGKPSIAKAFSPASILVGGTSTVTFTLNNITVFPLTDVEFDDPLAGMVVATPPAVANTCGGMVTAMAGSSNIALAGGALAALGSCTVSVNVTSSTGGVHPNTASGVSSTQSGDAGPESNTAALTVVAAPVAAKAFSPVSVKTNVPSTMTITVENPNTTVTINDVSFTDSYPAGMRNDTPVNVTLNCTAGSTATISGGVNNGTNVGLTGGTLAPGGSCTITANVEGTTTGNKTNTTGAIASSNAGTGAAASADLNVSALNSPSVAKAFSPVTVAHGEFSTMTITLSANNTTAINGVAFSDDFPAGLAVHATPSLTNTCGGTVTGATAGSTTLSLSGGIIPASSFCAVSVRVSSPDTGLYSNSTGVVTTTNAGIFGPATASLNVLGPPQISKTFNPTAIATGGDTNGAPYSTLTITLSNPASATASLTGVGVVDNFPANVVGHRSNVTSNTCGGTFTDQGGGGLSRNDTGIILSGVTLAPNASCSITVRVRSATAGVYTNTTNAVTSTNGGTGVTASDVLSVGRPAISKAFSAGGTPIAAGAPTTLTLTLSNPTGTAMTNAAVTDVYPAGMENTATPGGSTTCAGGTVAATAGWGSVGLSGATIPANGSCTVTVQVQTTKTVTNTIAAGDLTIDGPGQNEVPAAATLLVYAVPGVGKAFSPALILPSETSQMTISLSNANAVAATGVAFTDEFPSGLFIAGTPATGNTCGGTLEGWTGAEWEAPPAGGHSRLRLFGGTIPASSSCSVEINVTSATAADYNNETGAVTTSNIGTGASAAATLVVMGPLTTQKAFTPASILVGYESIMTVTLTNPNSVAITGAAFSETYPGFLLNASTPAASTSCPGGVVSATADDNTLALSAATIPANGSCTVSVRVTSAVADSYLAGTGPISTANAGVGAQAQATLIVNPLMPLLSVTKLTVVVSDPVNGAANPKSIPGAIRSYTIQVSNSGPGAVDNDSMLVTDVLPSTVALYVGDLGGPGSGPVQFTDGPTSSGLVYTFTSLASGTDDIAFSNNNGATWTYTPVPDGNGFDPSVTHVRITPRGTMPAAGGGDPSFTLQYQVRVQ